MIPPPLVEVIVQKNKRFLPDFIAVPLGSMVQFENNDQEIHNIHSKAKKNRFDLGVHLPGTVKKIVFQNPGPVPIRCQTHEKMRGMIYVSPSPFFFITDPDGNFEIKNVPPGSYGVGVWHPRLSLKEAERGKREVEIHSEVKEVHLKFSAEAREGADLTEVTGGDWDMVVDKMAQSFEEVISKVKKGRGRAATTQTMLIRSKLYIGMGLKNAIFQSLGEEKAIMYDDRLDKIRKQIQGIEGEKISETILSDGVNALIKDLKADMKKLPSP